MWPFRKYDRHAKLMDQVANAVGIDLDEAVQRGELTEEMVRDGVLACVGCSQPGDCADWIADHKDGADETPAYCRNRNLLDLLAPG